MTAVYAIDPGPVQSAYVLMVEREIDDHGIVENVELLERIWRRDAPQTLAIEMIASYGMPVGREVFETCTFFISTVGFAAPM